MRSSESQARHFITLADAVIEVKTSEPIEFIDLTDHINTHLAENQIESGQVTVFSRHTTAAIKINEAEELLLLDFKRMLRELCPPHAEYDHNDMSRRKPPIAPDERPNAHSHLMHLLLSTSETIPVIDGRLALGTWQRVFLVELDGPRPREVMIRCAGLHPHERAETVELRAHNGSARRARAK
ncbi:MAG TPA: secondary thiamine-phosphate synthase enzyme YjbQ [Candidatus Binataceae bacterium]|nr:secondary thiamine-phosphate synthase enzyme YjbQ [Candidatus Binataceae bacterium]